MGTVGNNSKAIRWLTWDRMAITKREVWVFMICTFLINIAFLEKRVWKFCNQNFLVTRLFKALYFLGTNILQATKGSGSRLVGKMRSEGEIARRFFVDNIR